MRTLISYHVLAYPVVPNCLDVYARPLCHTGRMLCLHRMAITTAAKLFLSRIAVLLATFGGLCEVCYV